MPRSDAFQFAVLVTLKRVVNKIFKLNHKVTFDAKMGN